MRFKSLAFLLCLFMFSANADSTISIGSKMHVEAKIMAEAAAQILEAEGFTVERRFGLGGTLINYRALEQGDIDLYLEYSGTLSQTILKKPELDSIEKLQDQIQKSSELQVMPALGFNNTYALVVPKKLKEERNLTTIGDLSGQDLKVAFEFEFLSRKDGWPGLSKLYGLESMKPEGMDQTLTYASLSKGRVDVSVAFSTDAEIEKFNLFVLEDDKGYFPKYFAFFFIRKDFPESAQQSLSQLSGKINNDLMREMNALAQIEKQSIKVIAKTLLDRLGISVKSSKRSKFLFYKQILKWMGEHLLMTGLAILAAILLAVPLGILLLPFPKLASVVIGISGLLQTIPSIALLAFMLPYFGIGSKPAIVGLFLYSLLPILRNTYVGLSQIDRNLIEAARAIGLYPFEILTRVQLPIGLPVIMAGVRTATVISIGTATLAAFIGAGGLGVPIYSGLQLMDNRVILQGAIPAAILAVLAELMFIQLDRYLKSDRA